MSTLTLVCSLISSSVSKPNFLLVVSDDFGYGEVTALNTISPHGPLHTPRLDAFASQGILFTDAYAGYTVCAPSRASLFTGYNSGNFYEKKVFMEGSVLKLSSDLVDTALPSVLQKAGYVTYGIGKIAPYSKPGKEGWDHFIGQISQSDCHCMYPPTIDSTVSNSGNQVIDLPLNKETTPSRDACMAHPEKFNYTFDITHDNAVSWLSRAATEDKPFFMYVAYTVPHAGGYKGHEEVGSPVPTDGSFTNRTDWPVVERDHAGVIEYMDTHFGLILDQLDHLSLSNKTLVAFVSDNGAHSEGSHSHLFFNSTGGLRGYKRSLYEGGVRSPSIIRWPGVTKPGVSNFQWGFWDVLPTFADLAGAPIPSGLDGKSFAPVLRGESSNSSTIFFTWVAPHTKPVEKDGIEIGWGERVLSQLGGSKFGYGIRSGKWKGVAVVQSSGIPTPDDYFELYDLSIDPFEENNIASDHSDLVKQLKNIVLEANYTAFCYQC